MPRNFHFFLPYQKRWIEDSSRIKIMEKSRQIGISWASAYGAVRQALQHPRTNLWISSRDEIQAKLFLNDCKTFANLLDTAYTELNTKIFPKKQAVSTYALRFSNRSFVHSMSSNPDAQAGKRGTRILDEFALHPNPEQLYTIAYPGITWGGQLEIVSTHRGSNNFFNQLIQEARHNGNPKNISLHRVTLVDALEQGFLKRLKQKLPPDDVRQTMDEDAYINFIRSSCASEEVFLQEYMCLPGDENQTFLRYESIRNCLYECKEAWQKTPKSEAFLGVDIAREHDLSVFWLLEKVEDVFYTRRFICLQKSCFDEQEAVLNEFVSASHCPLHVCIDQTGIGRQFVERAQGKFGKDCIRGVTFTPHLKENLAYTLKNAFDRQKIRIPNDPALVTDLRSIRLVIGSGTHTRFEAKHTDNGHADRFWAIALALYAATQKPSFHFGAELLSSNRRHAL